MDATEQDVTWRPFSVEQPAAKSMTMAVVMRRNSRLILGYTFFAKI
jgi:hypothetical protein